MKVPDPIHTVAAAVYEMWRKRGASEKPRSYLGASIIGGPCERALWYGFRQAGVIEFDGRLYRLFYRGHREEETVFDELRAIGCDVREFDQDGKQWSISDVGGHFRGHLDAAANGTPYAAKTWAVVEVKTHSAKSFAELQKKGVQESKPQHYAQMQVYMGKTGMDRAMYYAVCKDDDQIYTEWIHFDKSHYDKMIDRAHRVITSAEPPLRISNDSSYFVCKMCDYAGMCHGNEAPLTGCRTCAHSTPELDGDGRWSCAKHGELSNQCEDHRYIPALLEKWAEYLGSDDGTSTKYKNKLTGNIFTNGDYSSEEIRAANDKRAIGNADIDEYRGAFGARVAA